VEQIASVLNEAGLDLNLLELEITEGMVMNEPERVEKSVDGTQRDGHYHFTRRFRYRLFIHKLFKAIFH
jgi:EAL domain-containing protein (putative c-di-GMP-specific phosphodiesterase class I)